MTIGDFLKKYQLWIMIAIFILAFLLRVVPIGKGDLYLDNALYSVRALTWSDFIDDKETAPIQWLGKTPFWTKLSFHDAPPLVLFTQHVSLGILGDHSYAARWPFVLFGTLLVALVFYAVRRLRGLPTAVLASLFLTVSSYAVWASLAGYLEGVEYFFVAAAFFSLTLFLQDTQRQTKYFYLWAVAVAAAILCKFTAVFLLPAGLVAWWLTKDKKVLADRGRLVKVGLLLVVILSPVIIYNLSMFSARGHFDAVVSSVIGSSPTDFGNLASRQVEANFGSKLISILTALWSLDSIFYLVLITGGLVYLLVLIACRRADFYQQNLVVHLLWLLLVLLLAGVGDRFLIILVPFMSLLTAEVSIALLRFLRRYRYGQFAGIILLGVVMGAELLFAVNTNVLHSAWPASYRAENGLESRGFNELEDYLRQDIFGSMPKARPLRTKEDFAISGPDVAGRPLVIYDDSLDWFATWWHLKKYLIYYHLPVIGLSDFGSSGSSLSTRDFRKSGDGKVYFVAGLRSEVMDPTKLKTDGSLSTVEQLTKALEQAKVEAKVINDKQGRPSFKVYTVSFDIEPKR